MYRLNVRWNIFVHNVMQFLISFDQVANTLIGVVLSGLRLLYLWPWEMNRWWADETISAHSWRLYIQGKRSWPMCIIDAIFLCIAFEKDHCKKCDESEKNRTHSPISQR